jgi:hypothetical protein
VCKAGTYQSNTVVVHYDRDLASRGYLTGTGLLQHVIEYLYACLFTLKFIARVWDF